MPLPEHTRIRVGGTIVGETAGLPRQKSTSSPDVPTELPKHGQNVKVQPFSSARLRCGMWVCSSSTGQAR